MRLATSLQMTETTQVLTTALNSLAILRSVKSRSPSAFTHHSFVYEEISMAVEALFLQPPPRCVFPRPGLGAARPKGPSKVHLPRSQAKSRVPNAINQTQPMKGMKNRKSHSDNHHMTTTNRQAYVPGLHGAAAPRGGNRTHPVYIRTPGMAVILPH